ncbi:hypothetical protein N7G274_009416 [Stereocaulon virgatum]|uniref:Uncharacterized protein n=1 Tax=Stereocaulon virgatum TaxID=373712 RepID=A0ABR3ZZ17_9LECA
MSAIFQDASATLQGFQSSPYQPSLNLTRSRLPLSQARGIGFGSAAYANNDISPRAQPQSSGKKANRKPVSSGLVTPSTPCSLPSEIPAEIPYPVSETWQLPQSSSIAYGFGPSRDGSQSSHGILEVTAFSTSNTKAAQSADIDSWLANIPTSTGKEPPSNPQSYDEEEELVTVKGARFSPSSVPTLPGQRSVASSAFTPLQGIRPLSRTSSNKENLDPAKSSPSPKRFPIQHLPSTPSRFRNPKTQPYPQSVSILRFAHPSTLQGHLSLPPMRKRTRTANQTTSSVKPTTSTNKDFTIHDDQLAEALAELSPLVERHRKGRGPKRERCMSYFDEDVIEIGSPGKLIGDEESGSVHKSKDRQVLVESKNSAELTRGKPFLKGVEEAAFAFHI